MIVDSHCHIHFPQLADQIPQVVERMRAAGVSQAVVVCTSLDDLGALARLTSDYDELYASVGVHPCAPPDARCETADIVAAVAGNRKFVAIGESGLDFTEAGSKALDWQRPWLEKQIAAALQTSLPLIIHTRNTIDETLDIIAPHMRAGLRAVLHCFTGTWLQAARALELGCLLSFTGIVTFKNAAAVLDVARQTPLERLMVETDAPYLAPVPMRGKINEPAFVRHTVDCIARARDMDAQQLARRTARTAREFFALDGAAS